jgi:hypothetical protein
MKNLILLNKFVKLFNDKFKVVIDMNFDFKNEYHKDNTTFYITYGLDYNYNPVAVNKINEYERYIDKHLMNFNIDETENQPLQDEINEVYKKIHSILIEYGYLSFQKTLDTYQLVQRNWFRILKEYDSYGSSLIYDEEFKIAYSIYNNYDDIACINRDKLTIYTLFIIREDWVCEVGDVCYNIDKQQFYLNNYNTFYFPEELRKIPLDVFSGKAAFYYHPEINTVVLKCDDFTVTKIPSSIIHSNGYINLVYDKSLLRKIKIENINI